MPKHLSILAGAYYCSLVTGLSLPADCEPPDCFASEASALGLYPPRPPESQSSTAGDSWGQLALAYTGKFLCPNQFLQAKERIQVPKCSGVLQAAGIRTQMSPVLS